MGVLMTNLLILVCKIPHLQIEMHQYYIKPTMLPIVEELVMLTVISNFSLNLEIQIIFRQFHCMLNNIS